MLGVSERLACRVTGQHRATQRRQPTATTPADAALRTWLRAYAGGDPRADSGPPTTMPAANARTSITRRFKDFGANEGLRVPQRQHRTRRGTSTTIDAPTADAPNPVWALREFRLPDDLREQKDRALDKPDSYTT